MPSSRRASSVGSEVAYSSGSGAGSDSEDSDASSSSGDGYDSEEAEERPSLKTQLLLGHALMLAAGGSNPQVGWRWEMQLAGCAVWLGQSWCCQWLAAGRG